MTASIEQLRADMALKRKQYFWESPKGIAAVVAAAAVALGGVGTLAGLVGYKIGTAPPPQIVLQPVFQPGAIVLQLPAVPPKP